MFLSQSILQAVFTICAPFLPFQITGRARGGRAEQCREGAVAIGGTCGPTGRGNLRRAHRTAKGTGSHLEGRRQSAARADVRAHEADEGSCVCWDGEISRNIRR